jgi:cob(I)alamin adenosyltransferase
MEADVNATTMTAMTTRRLVVLTGDGKGKTTAALGMVLRATGHGHRALIVQFIKSDAKSEATTGEVIALRQLANAEIVLAGLGFVPPPEHPAYPQHRQAAEAGLELVDRALRERRHALVVLDEVCTAIAKGLLDERATLDVVASAGPGVCIVLTGRGASDGLLAAADTATEMRCLKHALQQRRPADKGVEW